MIVAGVGSFREPKLIVGRVAATSPDGYQRARKVAAVAVDSAPPPGTGSLIGFVVPPDIDR